MSTAKWQNIAGFKNFFSFEGKQNQTRGWESSKDFINENALS